MSAESWLKPEFSAEVALFSTTSAAEAAFGLPGELAAGVTLGPESATFWHCLSGRCPTFLKAFSMELCLAGGALCFFCDGLRKMVP